MPYVSARKPTGQWGIRYIPGNGKWLPDHEYATKVECERHRQALTRGLTDDGPPDPKDVYREQYLRRKRRTSKEKMLG